MQADSLHTFFYKCGLEVLTCLCPLIGVFNINYSLTIEPSLTGSPHIVLCIAAHLPLKHVAHIPSAAMKISNQSAAGPWHTAVIEQALLIHFSKRNLNLTMDSCLNVKLHLCESDKLDILVFFSETTPCVRLSKEIGMLLWTQSQHRAEFEKLICVSVAVYFITGLTKPEDRRKLFCTFLGF